MGGSSGKLLHSVIVPIAILVALAMSLVGAFVWYGAKSQDEIALAQSVEAVQGDLQRRLEKLAVTLWDYGWWNDAVVNLDMSFDRQWADENVGLHTYNTLGYELSAVLRPDDSVLYAQLDGEHAAIDPHRLFGPDLGRLLRAVRTAPPGATEQATGILPIGDGLAFVAVMPIVPHTDQFEPPARPPLILMFADRIDQTVLGDIEEPLPIDGLHLIAPGEEPATEAVLPLVSPGGRQLGALAWEPHRPGQEFLRSVAPALTIAVLVLVAFTVAVLQHARLATRAIEASEARFKDVADASSDWIWETDRDLRLRFLSSSFAEAGGEGLHLRLGVLFNEVFHAGDSFERWQAHLEDLANWRPFRNVLCLCEDPNGLTRTVRVSGKPVLDRAGRPLGFRGTATDITTEIEAGRRAEFLAQHDPLTGLPNRTLLSERLDQAVAAVGRRGDHAALVLVDMDHFKDVNDTLGHPAGDRLLKACAERLSASAREIDTVARIGGDEFAIVQSSIAQPADANQLCQRILRAFQTPFELDGHEVLASVSIGCALIPGDGSIPEKLLQHADIALYRAKEDGRNTARFFEPEMDARLQRRKALERELRLAITRDELEIYFQPKITLAERQLAGVEALVRWNHPVRGLIPPGEFIGIAEETGMIIALGEWVLREACRQGLAWPDLHVAVNISPVQFRQTNLVEVVRDVLAETGLPPHQLELEITESVLIGQPGVATAALEALKQLGVRIAMDDFGTGYSSLSYLHRFPFDKIKVDRSFINMLGSEVAANAVVRAVVRIARDLGMSTCAEGVETDQQVELLRQEGCDEGQGYLFGKPMTRLDFEGFRSAWLHGSQGQPAAAPA